MPAARARRRAAVRGLRQRAGAGRRPRADAPGVGARRHAGRERGAVGRRPGPARRDAGALDAGVDAGEVSTTRYREIDAALDRVAAELGRAAGRGRPGRRRGRQRPSRRPRSRLPPSRPRRSRRLLPRPPRSPPQGQGIRARGTSRRTAQGRVPGRSPMRPGVPGRGMLGASGRRWPAREEQHHGHHPRRHGSTGPGPAGRRPRAGRCVRRAGSAVRHRAVPRAAAVRPDPVRRCRAASC